MAAAVALTPEAMSQQRKNPFLVPYGTQFNIPPFEKITYDDYLPAIKEGIARREQEVEKITGQAHEPTFANTVLALEKSGELLNRVMMVFSSLDETNSSPEMVAISEVAYPLVSQSSDELMMNSLLFGRVEHVYETRDEEGLNPQQKRAVEELYREFVRSGAKLNMVDQMKLKKINSQLTELYLQYNKNLLNATNQVARTRRQVGVHASGSEPSAAAPVCRQP